MIQEHALLGKITVSAIIDKHSFWFYSLQLPILCTLFQFYQCSEELWCLESEHVHHLCWFKFFLDLYCCIDQSCDWGFRAKRGHYSTSQKLKHEGDDSQQRISVTALGNTVVFESCLESKQSFTLHSPLRSILLFSWPQLSNSKENYSVLPIMYSVYICLHKVLHVT